MTYLRLINHQTNRGLLLPDQQVLDLWVDNAVHALIIALAHITALAFCVLVATTIVLLLAFLYVGPKRFLFLLPFDFGGFDSSPADMWLSFELELLDNGDPEIRATSASGDMDVNMKGPQESANLSVPLAIVHVDSKTVVSSVVVPQLQPVQSSTTPLKISKSQTQAQSLAKFLEETKAHLPHPSFSPALTCLPLKLELKPTGLVGNTRGIRFLFLPASSSSTSISHSSSGQILDTDIILWGSGTTSPLYQIRHSAVGHPNLRVHGKEDFARDGHLQTLSHFQEDFPQGYFRVDLQLARDGVYPRSPSASSLASSCLSSSSLYPQTESQTRTTILSTMEYCTLTDMFQILSPGMRKPTSPDALYLWRRFDDFVKMPMVPAPKARRGRKVRGPEPAPVQVRMKEAQEDEDGWDGEVEVEGSLKPKKRGRRLARGGRRNRKQFHDFILRQANFGSLPEQGGLNFKVNNGDPDFSAMIRIPIAQEDDDRDRKFSLEISLSGSNARTGFARLDCDGGYENAEEGERGWGENGVIDEAMLEAEWMQECVYAAWLIFVGLVRVDDSTEQDPTLGQ